MFALLFMTITPCLSFNGAVIENNDSKLCILDFHPEIDEVIGEHALLNIPEHFPLGECCGTCDNQIWKFEKHPDLTGYYKIVNTESNEAIDNQQDRLRTSTNNDDSDQKYWEFLFDNQDIPNYFRMINLAQDICIIGDVSEIFRTSTSSTSDSAYWRFHEEYDIVGIDFGLDGGEFISNTPFAAGGGICNNANGGSAQQEIRIIISETRTETSSFQHSHGFTISVGTTFKTGIPFISQGKISTEISTSHDYVFGETSSVEKQFTTQFPVRCDPGEIIQVECIIFTAEIDVPYTINVLGLSSGVEFPSNGIFKGVFSYEFVCDFTYVNPSDNRVLFTERRAIEI